MYHQQYYHYKRYSSRMDKLQSMLSYEGCCWQRPPNVIFKTPAKKLEFSTQTFPT